MNRKKIYFFKVAVLLASMIFFFIVSTQKAKADDDTENLFVDLPRSISLGAEKISGGGCILNPRITNKGDSMINAIRITIDSDDYMDDILLLNAGSLYPGEKKTLCVSSIFNGFIGEWKGQKPLLLSVTVSYLDGKGFHEARHDIPVMFSGAGMEAASTKGRGTMATLESDDGFFDHDPPTFSMSRGHGPSRRIATYLNSLGKRKKKLQKTKDRVVVNGRVLSLFDVPLPNVSVSQKGVKNEIFTERDGSYSILAVPGKIALEFRKDMYHSDSLSLECPHPTSFVASDIRLVPNAEKTSMTYLSPLSGQLVYLPDMPMKASGDIMTKTTFGIKSMGHVETQGDFPEFFFICGRGKEISEPVLSMMGYVDVNETQGFFGRNYDKVNAYIPLKTGITTVITPVSGGKAYKIKSRSALAPGNYVFSNTEHVFNILDIPMEPGDRYCFPFIHNNFRDIRLSTSHSSPAPVVISGSIKKVNEDGKTVLADICFENVARTWFTVTLDVSSPSRPLSLPPDFPLTFMMAPPSDGESATFVKLWNIELMSGNVISYKVTRTDDTAALFLALDMVYRGLCGRRFTEDDMKDLEQAADIASALSRELPTYINNVLASSKKMNNGEMLKNLKELAGFILKTLAAATEGKRHAFIRNQTVKLAGNTLAKSLNTAYGVLKIYEKGKLLKELVDFTDDAPKKGYCTVSAK